MMELQGPALEALLRRLTETPEDFLAEPRIGGAGTIHVAAVVHDLFAAMGKQADPADLSVFKGTDQARDRNRLTVTLILCWLLFDEWFRGAKIQEADLLRLLHEGARDLAAQVASRKFVTDPDRREEMVRLSLARLGYRPDGETAAQAQDRLTSLSSAERARVLKASREAEQRAQAIREALRRKAAQESADKWTRE